MPTPRLRSSLVSLPGRHFQEPGFARASIRVADAFSDELIRAAEEVRPQWQKVADEFPELLGQLSDEAILRSRGLFRTPLVWNITLAWVRAMRWPILATYSDGIQIRPPDGILSGLRAFSSISSFEVYLAHLADVCCGRLGSNDHNTEYGLYLNVPIWIPLAVRDDCRDTFARQIRMVIHHEAGHLRWRGGSLRAEHIAHARGISGLARRDWPASPADLAALLNAEYPEAWHNPEIRSLVLETRGGARLVRAWGERRRTCVHDPFEG